MASAVLGKVSPTPKGEYVSTQDYDRLDVVTHEGYPYLAKSNVPSGNLPTDELYWMPLLTGLDFAPGGYGLGGQVPLTTADAAVQTGFYRIWLQNTLGYTGYVNLMVMNNNDQIISQMAFGAGNKVFLRIYYNTWGNWVDCSPSAFAPSGYGLGQTAKEILDANAAVNNGWYKLTSVNVANAHIPFQYVAIHVTAYSDKYVIQDLYRTNGQNAHMRREMYNGTWGEWEWTNPPMNLGTEYRTTERWNGAVVYTKMVDCGALPDKGTKNVTFASEATAAAFAYYGRAVNNGELISIPWLPDISVKTQKNKIYITTTDYFGSWYGYVGVKYTK